MKRTDTPTRMFDIATQRALHGPHRPCFKYGNQEISADKYIERASAISRALLSYGLHRGEAVAIICDNRPEWNIVDIGVLQAGGVLMPLCKGLTAEEYVECLSQASVRVLFIENQELLDRFRLLLPQVPTIKKVFTIEPTTTDPGLEQFYNQAATDEASQQVEHRSSMVTTDDICTLIYTGGGTYSKLTHRMLLNDIAILANSESGQHRTINGNNALCTRYGRTKNYMNQMAGRTVNYPEH